ncbi:urease accessory protein [Pusillimonas sp. DMV24BSW_D]|uniref:urease accessory protein UreD n=1 Tax=Neopusillimonas aestuarii TaxID=2716226 RepID=UPI001408FCA5|nr:urease accessory protein UreD [Pusillimonas sp. DMV24BSW_D]QIM48551.1 urease accessory protein [Pusillimonas sp. DMV24BSW_D]
MQNWLARLELEFKSGYADKTVLSHKKHEGPLLVQKALYPENTHTCHASILHPPSGIAGGDHLTIDIQVHAHAHAVINTPGATRWYKANGKASAQYVTLKVQENAKLDWLPQENIIFEDADATTQTTIALQSGARMIGWEIVQLGSVCTNEHWQRGQLTMDLRLTLDDRLLWVDTGHLYAGHPLRLCQSGMGAFPVTATLWAFGPKLADLTCEEISLSLPWHDSLRAGFTQIPRANNQALSLVRVLGKHAQEVRALLIELWSQLRPLILNVAATPIRLWAT